MVRYVHIQNYRCLRDVEVRLEPLTVLVGANASGKSSFLAALCSRFTVADVWSRDPKLNARAAMSDDEQHATLKGWTSVRGSGGTSPFGPQTSVQLLQLDVEHLRKPSQLEEVKSLTTTGFGLANVFTTLTRKGRDAVAKQFCQLVPMFGDVDTRPLEKGTHRVVFQDRWQPSIWYEPSQVSDGSMLLFAFLLLQHQTPAPDIIAIEEPERSLHPYLMGELVKVLRGLATGKLGKEIQVILATHSAELLDFVEPKEVRFFSRAKDTGETRVEAAPIDSPQWKKVFTEYNDSLSGVWLSGGLGGVP